MFVCVCVVSAKPLLINFFKRLVYPCLNCSFNVMHFLCWFDIINGVIKRPTKSVHNKRKSQLTYWNKQKLTIDPSALWDRLNNYNLRKLYQTNQKWTVFLRINFFRHYFQFSCPWICICFHFLSIYIFSLSF